jgi:glycosyltransferase involved in cell wall biosynthesis
MILFIGPITNKHGQGTMTIEAMNALALNYDLDKVNTYTPRNHLIYNTLLIFRILLNYRKYSHVYLSLSRNLPKSFLDLIVLYKYRSTKVVTHLHGTEFDENLPEWFKITMRNLFKADNVVNVVLSTSHVKYAFGKANYRIVPNGLNFNRFEPHRNVTEKLVFVHVSNPILSKGLDTSLKYYSILLKEKSSIKLEFNVIGWTLEDAISYGLESYPGVKFHGKLYGDQKEKVLRESNIMLYPTRYKTEAQPLVILEALNCGCKCLVTNFKMMSDFTEFSSVRYVEDFQTLNDLIEFNNRNYSDETRNKLVKYSLDQYQENIMACFE